MPLGKSRLNIEEIDGSPSLFPYKLKVTNGTLTDNGDGTATLTVTGGSGSPGGSDTQLQYNNAGAFGGISGVTTNGTALTAAAIALGSDATGDIYYRNSSGNLTRLAIGTSTQVLTVTAGLPSWADATGGGGTPGGSNTQVQFNNAGAFGGISGVTSNGTALTALAVNGLTTMTPTMTSASTVLSITPTWNQSVTTFVGLSINVTDTASHASSVLFRAGVGGVYSLTLSKDAAFSHTSSAINSGLNFITNQTWNSGTTTFDAIRVNITDTTSQSASNLINLRVGGATKFRVQKDGSPFAATYQLIGGTLSTNGGAVIGGAATWDVGGTGTAFGLLLTITDTSSHTTNPRLIRITRGATTYMDMTKTGGLALTADALANAGTVWSFVGGFNSAASVMDGIKINITDTSSPATSAYFRVQKTAVDMLAVKKDGVLHMLSGQVVKTTSVSTTSYTVLVTDFVINVTTTAAAITVNLPTATGNAGRHLIIKDVSGQAATNNITVDANGSQLIDGTLTKVISGNFGALTLVCTGSAWSVV